MNIVRRSRKIYSLTTNFGTQSYSLVAQQLKDLPEKIHERLATEDKELEECSKYLFDGRGKSIRPSMSLLMSGACNYHCTGSSKISASQETVAMVTEMIHTASLVHDDVIDMASIRRGNFILSRASMTLAQIRNTKVVELLSTVINNLVQGELMQLGMCQDQFERFDHYLQKCFMKTASLMAHSCQAVATLASADDELHQTAYCYGENVGMAFQLVDDMLDYKSTAQDTGKPTAVDLHLGLATAPVLYAVQQYPELNELIDRKFKVQGDVEMAQDIVHRSNGLELTHQLAAQHCHRAVEHIQRITKSPEQDALIKLTEDVLNRSK